MNERHLAVAGLLVGAVTTTTAEAGSYVNDFSAGVGAAELRGAATLDTGSVRLTQATSNQRGSLAVPDLDPGVAVGGFTAAFGLSFGPAGQPTPADGISFVFGTVTSDPNSIDGNFGVANGLAVSFDTFNEGGAGNQIGIVTRVDGVVVATNPTNPFTVSNGQFVPVAARLDADGTLDLTYNGAAIFTNVATGFSPATGDRFGFGARTGGFVSEQRVDNVSLATIAVPEPAALGLLATGGVGLLGRRRR